MEQSHIMDSTVPEQNGPSEQDGARVVRDDDLPQLDVPDAAQQQKELAHASAEDISQPQQVKMNI